MRNWLPPLVWMALIFGGSTEPFSSDHTSRIIAPVLRWLIPGLSEPTVELVVHLVRKAAHLCEYAILAGLWWRALREPARRAGRAWDWTVAGQCVLLCALWAASDELHQAFTATRTASGWDVLLDTTGAVLGLLLLRVVVGWRPRIGANRT